MPAPEYRFISRWRVLGTAGEVSAVLEDARELPRWWPSVYLDVEELEAGGEHGVGRRVRLRTKGFLPCVLVWELRVTESRRPHGFTVAAQGDLAGEGAWTFEPAGAWTVVTYDWRVRAEKPLLRALAPVFSPLLAANHRWAMRMGETSLALELARRRTPTAAGKAKISPPPPPVPAGPFLVGAAAVAATTAFLLARRFGRRRSRRRWYRQ